MNAIFYHLPKLVHRFIRFVTGYYLVKHVVPVYLPRRKLRRMVETVHYYWRKA